MTNASTVPVYTWPLLAVMAVAFTVVAGGWLTGVGRRRLPWTGD